MNEMMHEPDPLRSVAQAREEFPSILEAAEAGLETVITRRGKPVALIGPVSMRRSKERVTLGALQGSGKGLWGAVGDHVRGLRDEW